MSAPASSSPSGRLSSPFSEEVQRALEPLTGVPREQRELRFTRNAWALWLYFWGVYLVLGMVMVSFINIHPPLPIGVRLLIWVAAGLLAAICFFMAVRCMARAYVLLTPLGVEILPLRQPEKRMRVYPWHGIKDWEPRLGGVVLQMADGATAKINLLCMRSKQRELLTTALTGRIMQKIHIDHDSSPSK